MGKRAFDAVAAAAGLTVLAPVLAAVALVVRLRLGRPVFFRQRRTGRGGAPFTLVKFRTMTDETGSDGRPLADGCRLTRLGRSLRATSIDELPSLWNVLRGDMSLVGPRPLLPEYLPLYDERQARRHEVRPGVTGWAQVRGRNTLDWDDRLEADVWYVDHRSFALDLRILAATLVTVLKRQGIAATGAETMPPFRGSGER